MSSGEEGARAMELDDAAIIGRARVFADASVKKPAEWFDWEGLRIPWGPTDPYELVAKIGRGHFGEVFEAVDTARSRRVVAKVLKPVRDDVIQREVKFLYNMRDGPNIVKLLDTVCDPVTMQKSLIFEYVRNPDFKELYLTFSDADTRYYMFQLLRALHFTHSNGVIHRDVKPHNVLIDPKRRVLRLIDWGLAAYYYPQRPFTKFPGTRVFKAPELLLQYELYDYSADMWSFGCLLGGIMFQRHPLFRGRKENLNVLQEIVKIMGSEDLLAYIERYKISVPTALRKKLKGRARVPFTDFINSKNKSLATDDGLSLLSGLLCYDHERRLTVVEAMAHPYFDSVRGGESGQASGAASGAASAASGRGEPASGSSSGSSAEQ
eukprot:c5982_g1_i1.p1 GENE.c5982_g1_i1~~c5982_g1_i1.p1  ORF type:complete len:379 (+),score=64.79 c5982_g1_i1:239-1375(+)